MDIFYISMVLGIIYLAVAPDWLSRGGRFCVEALENTLSRHGKPEMFNTDQGSQFTARLVPACQQTKALRSAGMRLEGATPNQAFFNPLLRLVPPIDAQMLSR
jgi:hypothetical protein